MERISQEMSKTTRPEICRDQRLCKIYPSCVYFPRKQHIFLKICAEMLNSHNYLFTHTPFLQNYWNFTFVSQFQQKRTKIVCIKIYAVLSLAKVVPIYAFWKCKFCGPKIWPCKFVWQISSLKTTFTWKISFRCSTPMGGIGEDKKDM